METIGIVVLNYKNYNETLRCVESLVVQKNVLQRIVIVDNGSGNESAEVLKRAFAEEQTVSIIELPENVGFAKGMNAGIEYLRKEGIDSIFICNSDLVFSTESILAQIADSGKLTEKDVAVINPVVFNVDGTPTHRIFFQKKMLKLRMIKTFFPVIENVKVLIKGKAKKGNYDSHEKVLSKAKKTATHENEYMVVGSGYMLTKEFFKYYPRLFPETFLYGEEYALILFLHAVGLKTSFVNTDIIYHKHGASTSSETKKKNNNSNKLIMKLIAMSKGALLKKYGYPT